MAEDDVITVTLLLYPFGETGTFTNTAEVAHNRPDSNPIDNVVTETTTFTTPDLTISQTDSPDPATVGQLLTYTIHVTNNGPGTATGIVVTDTLPANVTLGLNSASAYFGSCSYTLGGSYIQCDLNDIESGGVATITVAVTPTLSAIGTITNVVEVTSDPGDLINANNFAEETTHITTPDLVIRKFSVSSLASVGEPITYTVLVTNTGPGIATSVIVTDTLPANVTLGLNSAWALPGSCSYTLTSSEIHCRLNDMSQGAIATITIVVTPTLAAVGAITNTAEVSHQLPDSHPSDDIDNAIVVVKTPDLSIVKSDAPDPVAVSDPLTYTLVITNHGPGIAHNVWVTDTLQDNQVFYTVLASQGSCYSSQATARCSLGNLSVGGRATVTVLLYPFGETGLFTNTARVAFQYPDSDPSNNLAIETTHIGDELIVVDATTGGTLTYTDGQGNTTSVTVPAGAVTDTTSLLYTAIPTITGSAPSGFSFAGHAFSLDAYQNSVLQSPFTFSAPIVVKVTYSDSDVSGLVETALKLNYWDGSNWMDAANTCTPASAYTYNPAGNWFSLPICHLTDFAAMGETGYKIYLPLVLR